MPAVSRTVLAVTSYAPLFALLGLTTWHDDTRWALAFYALAAGLTILLMGIVLYLREAAGTHALSLGDTRNRTEELGAYAATYLLPFVSFGISRWQTALAIFLFIGLLIFIYVRARLPYLNPLLLLFGYRLVEIRHRDPNSSADDPYQVSVALTRTDLARGALVDASFLQRPEGAEIGVVLIKSVRPTP